MNDTLTSLKEKKWISRGKQCVKHIIRQCVPCLKYKGPPYSCGGLPHSRVSDDPLFTYAGIDFAKPLHVNAQESDQSEYKTYTCFSCVLLQEHFILNMYNR